MMKRLAAWNILTGVEYREPDSDSAGILALNYFTSVPAPQTAIGSLGGPGMIQKENNCNKIKVKKKKKTDLTKKNI